MNTEMTKAHSSTSPLTLQILNILCVLCVCCTLNTPSTVQARAQKLNWQVLGDISATYQHTKIKPATFVLGDIDLWFQRSFAERWSAMGELMIMSDPSAQGMHYMLHPARLFLDYAHSDKLQLRFGQIHTPIGLYSQLYPHGGRFFEPTLNRPLLARVREGEDIFPFHSLGISARGTFMIGESLEMMYIVGIGNGYTHSSFDTNNQKSPFLQLRFSPLDVNGLTFALSGYHDFINKDEITGGIEQSIVALSIYYDAFPFDILGECFVARNASTPSDSFSFFAPTDPDEIMLEDGTQPRKQIFGGYLQLSYLFGQQAIFSLVEGFERDGGDYHFDEHTPYTEYLGAELGHRYHWNQHLVLKTAYNYNWVDQLHRVDLQLAYRL